jgi:(2R)-ethylmalonyl-CoA mutase
MNTSMTINATAPWLLALYVATAERKGIARDQLSGTVQNDIMKEYLSRGTYVFPPKPSMKLTADVIAFTYDEIPRWNPTNVCSYHLQEAGATPEQELAFALSTAKAVIDAVKDTGQVPESDLPRVIGRIAFFVNAGMRFITEMCKMRAFVRLWDEITRDTYGVEDPKYRRFRYGMQVNSLGLTEQQPENNVYRILIEMLSVVLSKDARARAVQLPAWNEAMGLPRPWDQQWSIRMQQIMAYETDLLEYDDIFRNNPAIESKVDELCEAARAEIAKIDRMGGAVAAIEQGYMKERLVESNARRVAAIENGEQTVVGVNAYTKSEPSPLTSGTDGSFLAVDPKEEQAQIESLNQWREARDDAKAQAALEELKQAAREGRNIMEPSIACAHAGVTTGEWGDALREIYGEYRAPTGVGKQGGQPRGEQGPQRLADVQARVEQVSERMGRRLKMLVGKPGLDGHSNGAEQIAVRARDAGFEVVYEGIRLTPKQIVGGALEEGVHVVGLSILSGSHVELVQEVMRRMREQGLSDVPVVVGGIIPESDAETLRAAGVAAIYTPKDYDLTAIMADIVEIVDREGERAA